jgi:hypothetical protein
VEFSGETYRDLIPDGIQRLTVGNLTDDIAPIQKFPAECLLGLRKKRFLFFHENPLEARNLRCRPSN